MSARRALALRTALAAVSLACGAVVAAAVVLLHSYAWGFTLGVAATAAALWALPRRSWTRSPFALGWCLAVAGLTQEGPGGDLLIPADRAGYLLLACCVPVLVVGTVSAFARRDVPAPDAPSS